MSAIPAPDDQALNDAGAAPRTAGWGWPWCGAAAAIALLALLVALTPSGSAARTWPAPAKHSTRTWHPSPPPRDSIRTGPRWPRESVPAAPVS